MAFVTTAAIVGGIGAVGNVVGGAIQADAAGKAAAGQQAAADKSLALQRQMYDQNRQDWAPWREAGAQALQGLQNKDFSRDFTAADFQADPGYAFRMAEGSKALERSAAARGGLMSGNFAKAITNYGQDAASQEYQNAYNRFNADRDRRFGRLSSIAGLGYNAQGATSAAGQNYANASGDILTGSAGQQGAAQMAGAQGWSNAISGVGNAISGGIGAAQNASWMDRWLKSRGA